MADKAQVEAKRIAPEAFDIGSVAKNSKARFLVKAGEFASGGAVEIPAVVVRGASDGPVVFICSGVHGEEPAGMDTVKRLAKQINPAEVSGTIVAAPLLNVPAYVHRTRHYPLDAPNATDVGASVPEKGGLLTARVTWVATDVLARDANYAVDLHATHLDSINYPRTMITSNGQESDEVQKIRYEIGKHAGFEINHLWLRPGKASGVTGTLNARGVPAVAMEAGEGWRALEPFPSIMLRGTLNILKYLKVVPGTPVMPPRQVDIKKRYEIHANYGGMSHLKVKTGDFVRKGQVLAEIRNLFDDVVEELIAPSNGIIVRTSLLPIVNTGARVCNVYETDIDWWESREIPELERQIVVSGW